MWLSVINKRLEDVLYGDRGKKLAQQINGQDLILFIGPTGSGKSTLVNHVTGNKLVAVKGKPVNIETIVTFKGSKINSPLSLWLEMPTLWKSNNIYETILDTKGFVDDVHLIQNIVTSFFIKEAINNAKTIKFVLLTDFKHIYRDINGCFANLFDIFNTCSKGIVLVILDDKPKLRQESLKKRIRKRLTLSYYQKRRVEKRRNDELIEYIFQNHLEQIVCLPWIKSENVEIKDLDIKDIVNTINNKVSALNWEEIRQLVPQVSSITKAFLQEEWLKLKKIIEIKEILINEHLNNKFRQLQSMDDARRKDEMTSMFTSLMAAINELKLSTAVSLIEDLILGDTLKEQRDVLILKIKFLEFVDVVTNKKWAKQLKALLNKTLLITCKKIFIEIRKV